MKKALSLRLAWSGIGKNRKLYFPYICSWAGMVMMFYIIHFLSYSPAVSEMHGGDSMQFILSLAKFVIAAFALLFLFYTNSFLVRRRYREFGLYNVLGMDKHRIGRIVLCESGIVAALGFSFGLIFGILLSKLSELGLQKVIGLPVDYRFSVSFEAIWYSVLIFGGIAVLILLKSLWQVRRCDPLELMRSENFGEKVPKANGVFAVIGAIMLGVAYYITLSVKDPLSALMRFFVAVILVIAATFLLFMSGSVAFCKLLQKRKSYYYRKQHFISVSSMVYRMKRNGAGLASICILCTMVLVMISSTSSLYFGMEDELKSRYPRNVQFIFSTNSLVDFTDGSPLALRQACEDGFYKKDAHPENEAIYRYALINGKLEKGDLQVEVDDAEFFMSFDQMRSVFVFSKEDYREMTGETLSLKPGETMLLTKGCKYPDPSIKIKEVAWNVVGTLPKTVEISDANASMVPVIFMVIADYDELKPLAENTPEWSYTYYYGYDLPKEDDVVVEVYTDQATAIRDGDLFRRDPDSRSLYASCYQAEKDDFFTSFGGLFFIGIMLSIVFIFAAGMIIYYKQVSEGYEDRSRFAIMQKIGMTKKDIKKSINSQILTVFFAPLLMAGAHLACTFPLVWKILQLFSLKDLSFAIVVTVIAYVCFALFYVLIYKMTARAYYSIVSSSKND